MPTTEIIAMAIKLVRAWGPSDLLVESILSREITSEYKWIESEKRHCFYLLQYLNNDANYASIFPILETYSETNTYSNHLMYVCNAMRTLLEIITELVTYIPICNLHSQPTFSHNTTDGTVLN